MSTTDKLYDLIVVGAGAGGMTAALTAAHKGLKVVLCEATEFVGGTTATSAGTLWLPGNSHGQKAGYSDTAYAAERYLDAICGADDRLARRRAFLYSAGPAIDFLEQNTELVFASAGRHPDYVEAVDAAVFGRAIGPVEFDGRVLGADFHRIRPPLKDFLLLGGMMVNKSDVQALIRRYRSWSSFVRTVRLVGRYARDRLRFPRGTRLVMGNALVARLLFSLRRAGVEIRFNARLTSLTRDETGRVNGATFQSDDDTFELSAPGGVVLATGGIGHGAIVRDELDEKAFESLTVESVRGDGITVGCEAGALLERHPGDFLWQPVSRVPDGHGGHRLFPHLYLDRAKPGLIAVDRQGRRFVNEGASYHHFVEGMLDATNGVALPAYLVCDSTFIRCYGLGIIPPGTRRLGKFERLGYVITASTAEALAQRLGIDSEGLAISVKLNNEYAASGQDPEYHKGGTEVSRFNGDTDHQPNPCLGLIGKPPFYAVPIWPADAASSSGLRTDADGRVLTEGDRAIEGLYACGNDMASIMRGKYPGPGATLGPAMVFGYRIALHVGARLSRSTCTRADDAPTSPIRAMSDEQ